MLVFAVSGTDVCKWCEFLFPHGASLPHAVPCFSGKGILSGGSFTVRHGLKKVGEYGIIEYNVRYKAEFAEVTAKYDRTRPE